ncbi:YsnF/AvaK domain-containing protein [Clostridium fermenticellae]|uniref:YsnF/AvaK domain-containing protein n=1 Tax=Clostridium fermenticellae TaxID=2068654 RepID=A0A386H1T4_9CLOT|nr:YsnF/AvaK domain-containing protein [Clostridium fermenticellae]AYD39667.1 YsnF/AvaK domain-containing protein [Clostridium fermenticellae]
MKIREEKLNISKEKVQTGKVSIHKEILTEKKNITVPIKKEQLVIEKTKYDPKDGKPRISETIRIPISGERVEVKKNPIVLQSVSCSKNKYKKVEHINEVIKKEVPHISIKGNVKVIDDGIYTK